jgi:hypothetical protein
MKKKVRTKHQPKKKQKIFRGVWQKKQKKEEFAPIQIAQYRPVAMSLLRNMHEYKSTTQQRIHL